MPTVMLVDDHALVRAGMRALFERAGGAALAVVGEAEDGLEAVRLAQRVQPDVAVVDMALPTLKGVEVVWRMREESPGTRAVILSMHADAEYVQAALRAGARGYVLKSAAFTELLEAVGVVLGGGRYLSAQLRPERLREADAWRGVAASGGLGALSARERNILGLIAEGASTTEMALALGVAARTVETHRYNLSRKLGLHTIADLTRFALRHGVSALAGSDQR